MAGEEGRPHAGIRAAGRAYARGLAGGARPTRRQLLAAVALAGLYAITDEFHQWFVAERGAAATDVLIDTAGAGLGVGVWEYGRGRMRE